MENGPKFLPTIGKRAAQREFAFKQGVYQDYALDLFASLVSSKRMIKRFTFLWLTLFIVAFQQTAWGLPEDYGATPHDGGVMFRVWAPGVDSVHVMGEFNQWSTTSLLMIEEASGVWALNVPAAQPGQTYRYVIDETYWKRDPRGARAVHSGANMPSVIYDHSAYEWQSDRPAPPSLEELVIYELHIGTFNDLDPTYPGASNFDAAREKLDHLVSLGVNAVEIMPVAEFPGSRSWGYNPTDLFSVQNRTYGGPDALKRFVDACHQRGLIVLLDIVHNHYGPGDLEYSIGNFTGPAPDGDIYFYQDTARAMTRWGPRPNYDEPQVRSFIKDNARMWLADYRIDGFRWDATKYIRQQTSGVTIAEGESLIKEVNELIQVEFPNAINIAEDLQQNSEVTAPLPGGLGFDSDWHTGFHFEFIEELTNSVPDLVRLRERLSFGNFTRRVIYTESHDEVGVLNQKVRVPVRLDPADPTSDTARSKSLLAAGFLFTAPGIPMLFQGQEMYETLAFNDDVPVRWDLTNTYSGILQFYKDAVHLRRDVYGVTGGLTGSVATATVQTSFAGNELLTLHRRNSGSNPADVFVVGNFSDNFLDDRNGGDWIDWPANTDGDWYAVLNSGSSRYGISDFGSTTVEVFPPEGVHSSPRGQVYMAPWSVIVFSRTPMPDDYTSVNLADTANAGMEEIQRHIWQVDRSLAAGNYSFHFTAPGVSWGAGTISPTWPRAGTTTLDSASNFTIPIPSAGTYRFTFNSATGEFSVRNITPIVRTAHHPSMAVAGNFNDWDTSPNMTLNTNQQWEYIFSLTEDWDLEFKFAAYDQDYNVSWGGSGVGQPQEPGIGTAIAQADDDIVIDGGWNGEYRITFDDRTLEYQIEKIDMPAPFEAMTFAANFFGLLEWLDSPVMVSNGLHQWSYTLTDVVRNDNLEFKFAANASWATSWSENTLHDSGFPVQGTAQLGEVNNTIVAGPFLGDYTVEFNSYTLDYSITESRLPITNMAVVGTFPDNEWNPAPNMTLVGADLWEVTVTLRQTNDLEFKFAANGSFDVDWGHDVVHSTDPLTDTAVLKEGANIRLQGPLNGDYTFTFNSATFEYGVSRDFPTFDGMAVAGNFNDWSTETNMTAAGEHEWTFSTEIVQAGQLEFKFVSDGSWDNPNWGGDLQFPYDFPIEGTAIMGVSQNLRIYGPFDGEYEFTLNSATLTFTVDRVGDVAPPPPINDDMAVAGTMNGWNTEPNMWVNAQNQWETTFELNQEDQVEFKFVTGGAWGNTDWGDSNNHAANNPAIGTATLAGDNIVVPGPFAGTYRFTFSDRTLAYRVELVSDDDFNFDMPGWNPQTGMLELRWPDQPGATFTIMHAETLVPYSFTNWMTGVTGDQIDVPMNDSPTGFYRIMRD